MAGLPPDVQAEGRRRRSLLSRRRLLEMGHHGARIDHWLAVGLITTRTRGHYIVSGAAVEELGRLLTAIERSGTGARIGGPWACGLHQLEGFDLTGDDHVLVPPRRRVRGVPFTVVRSPVPEIDRATVDGLPTITVTRSLIDVAATQPAKRVRVAYDSGRRAKATTLDELTARASALGRVHGAPQMRRLIATGQLRCESEGERDLDRLWRPGDPRPEAQVTVALRSRHYRLDFAYLDARLCLEYDGRDYHEPHQDHDRDLALAELDIQTLRIDSRMLRTPEHTRRRILAVRQQRLDLGLPPIVPSPPPATAG